MLFKIQVDLATYHIHKSHIHEQASSKCKYPHGNIVCIMTNQNPGRHAKIGQHSWQSVVQHSLLDSHTSFQEYSKISYDRENQSKVVWIQLSQYSSVLPLLTRLLSYFYAVVSRIFFTFIKSEITGGQKIKKHAWRSPQQQTLSLYP